MAETTHLNCPKCGTKIDVNAILYEQLQKGAEQKFEAQLAELRAEYNGRDEEFKREKLAIQKARAEIQVSIDKGVYERLLSEKLELEKRIRAQIDEEKSGELTVLREQLQQKVKDTKDLNKTKSYLAQILREKEELREQIEAEAEQKITTKLGEERVRIRNEVESKNQMKLAEKDYLIQQLKEQLTDSQRKIEQGSMQVQGEAQELEIDKFLRLQFPMDTVTEIRKGVRGADSLHQINSRDKQNHGFIYYESKRAKDFQPKWIEKFKMDMREKGALFGVLVTDVYPKGVERMCQMEGIWIASFEEFKSLCFVLRESVILLDSAVQTQENRGSKMEMLYELLTGNEFRMQFEAIVEGFSQMNNDLLKEKRAMEALWKQREKQIQKVILNTTHIYSSIKGIAGNAVQTISQLELAPETTVKVQIK